MEIGSTVRSVKILINNSSSLVLYVNQLWKSAPFYIKFETLLINRLLPLLTESEEQRVGQSYQLIDIEVITRKDSFTFAYLDTVDALRTCPAKH